MRPTCTTSPSSRAATVSGCHRNKSYNRRTDWKCIDAPPDYGRGIDQRPPAYRYRIPPRLCSTAVPADAAPRDRQTPARCSVRPTTCTSLSTRARADAELAEKILEVHAASNGTYGAPRIHAEFAAAGLRHGRKRIARRMRAAGIRGKSPRRWWTAAIPDPRARRPVVQSAGATTTSSGPDQPGIRRRWGRDRHALMRRHHLRQPMGKLALSGYHHRPGVATNRGLGRRRAPEDRPGPPSPARGRRVCSHS
ncbi:IS3 family transposase [Dactylosporangium sp. CA-052675]|uniref:IS3 family transposase n=1 Tax=Dactylosporangium sp. CA-052675 TaxID=3239927 RepID=UPI003D8D0759